MGVLPSTLSLLSEEEEKFEEAAMNRKLRDGHRTHVGSPERFAAARKDKLVAQAKDLERRLKQEGGGNNMLKMLRTFDPDRLDIEELVELSATAKAVTAEFAALQIPFPEWIDEKQKIVAREITRRVADDRARRLKDLKARRAALATADEKRQKLDQEIAAMEAVQ